MRATESTIVLNSSEMVVRKTLVNSIFYSYDENRRQTKKRVIPALGSERVTEYEYPNDSAQVSRFSVGERMITSHSKTDSFGRKVFDELQLVSNVIFADGRTLSYEYDAEERITRVVDSETGTTEYTYDALGQLLTEKVNDVTTGYAYDNYGNIIAKGVCDENGNIIEATKHTYTYGANAWKDLLTAYDGQGITYDIQRNPTGYMGHSLIWEKGRQLKRCDANTYTYNENGIRTSKTVNGVKHTYMLEGTKILRETWGANTLIPLYDCEDSVCGILYNNVPYYFRKNLQGDVIAVTDADANNVCGYSYDAWGVCTVTYDTSGAGIGEINPYRYRSYYYDSEIGMYYLQSRYYSPVVGRFINVDMPEIVRVSMLFGNKSGVNLLSYCFNEPINDNDISGFLSSKQLANMFAISSIAIMAWPILCISYAKGLIAVGGYATQIVTPIAIKAFWWKPWVATAIIIAAVAIIVAAVGIYFSKQVKRSKKERATNAPSWVSVSMNAMPLIGMKEPKTMLKGYLIVNMVKEDGVRDLVLNIIR